MDRNCTLVERSPNVMADVPRKGNVDRNADEMGTVERQLKTFPARGTWIEMSMPTVST